LTEIHLDERASSCPTLRVNRERPEKKKREKRIVGGEEKAFS